MKGETYARRKAQGCSCGDGCPCSKRQGSTCSAASQACDVVKERAFAVQNKLRLHHYISQSKAHMQRRSQVGEADLYRRVRTKLGPHVPRASVILYVRAARTSLPRAARTEGTGQLARARAATAVRYVRDVGVPPSGLLANRGVPCGTPGNKAYWRMLEAVYINRVQDTSLAERSVCRTSAATTQLYDNDLK